VYTREKKPVFALRGQAAPEKLQPNATVNAILHIIYNKQYSIRSIFVRMCIFKLFSLALLRRRVIFHTFSYVILHAHTYARDGIQIGLENMQIC
jgi:hypothetical protein